MVEQAIVGELPISHEDITVQETFDPAEKVKSISEKLDTTKFKTQF